MRVTLLTVGSRDDVQPLVALGSGLKAAGHRVRLATHPRWQSLVSRHELELTPLAEGDLSRGAETEEGRRWSKSNRLPPAVGFVHDARSVARKRLADAAHACDDADAIVAGNLAVLLGWQMAEMLGVPLVRAYSEPPAWMMTRRPTRRLAPVVGQAGWLTARPWPNAVRRDAVEVRSLGVPKPHRRLRSGGLTRRPRAAPAASVRGRQDRPRLALLAQPGGRGPCAGGHDRRGLARPHPLGGDAQMSDQCVWARQLHELGVGPAPIHRRQITSERFAEVIRVATGDPEMRRRAAALGERIRREDGVARGVEAFERCVGASFPTPLPAVTSTS